MNFLRAALCMTPLVLVSAAASHSQLAEHDMSPQDRWLRGQSVFTIAIAPQALSTQYFSAEYLKQSLPRLWPAHIRADWCEGKDRQRGVVVLRNGDVIFWHSCAVDLIVFEGDEYPGSFGFKDTDPSFSSEE